MVRVLCKGEPTGEEVAVYPFTALTHMATLYLTQIPKNLRKTKTKKTLGS